MKNNSYKILRESGLVILAAAFLVSGFFVSNVQAESSNITVTNPTAGVFWRGVQIITWTNSGSGSPPFSIFYSNDFTNYQNIISNVNDLHYNWDTTTVSNSPSYYIKVQNASGEFGISSAFSIDNTAPVTTSSVTGATPNGNGWYKTPPTVTLTCSDALSGCGNTYYKWGVGDSYSVFSAPLTALEGDNTLYYYSEDKAVDNTGIHNQEIPKPLNIKLDTGTPTISVTGAPLGLIVDKTGVTASAICEDGGSGCQESKLYVSSASVTNCSAIPYASYIVSPQTITTHSYVCAYAKDKAGNEKFSGPVEFNIFSTIQSAIDAATSTINIAAGNYPEKLDLKGKSLNIIGAGSALTTIDAYSFTDYAIQNFGTNSSVKNLKLIGSSNYGFKVASVNGITLDNIVVENSGKTGIDLNTVSNATLNNIEVKNTTYGFGLMILDSNNVNVTDITTANNAWGGVSIQTKNAISNLITFSGTFNVGDTFPLLLEKDPSTYYDITNITLPAEFGYVVYDFRAPDNYKQWYYFKTLDNAKTVAQGFVNLGASPYKDVVVYNVAGNNYYVFEGMKIQDAITAASAGNTINIAAGNYTENLNITKSITLAGEGTLATQGAGTGAPTIDGGASTNPATITINSDTAPITVTVRNLNIVNGQSGIDILQKAVMTIDKNTISGYYKNGITFGPISKLGSGAISGSISNNIVTGAGPITTVAQNGIQVSETNTATITNNQISGHVYTGGVGACAGNGFGLSVADKATFYNDCWLATGLLLYQHGSGVTVSNNTINNNQLGVDVSGPQSAGLHQNKISGSTLYGVHADTLAAVDAIHNWWGSAEGPMYVTNPHGIGDAVSNNVNFVSWCTDATCSSFDDTAPTAVLSDTPSNPTNLLTANVTVGGGGVVYYKYKLDLGSYGGETAVSEHIILTGLPAGLHTLSVIGRDQAGNWQNESSAIPYTWTVDVELPVLLKVTAVPVLTKDNTPDYTFSSTKPGTITYGGDCLSSKTSAIAGSNTVTFNTLGDGLHNNCTITVTDSAHNASDPLHITAFTVDTTAPVITTPVDVTREATAHDTPVTLTAPGVSDAIDPTPKISSDAKAVFPVGTTVVTWTATDAAGNSATASQNVTVTDKTAPSLLVPADITAVANALGEKTDVVLGVATATDVVDGSITPTNDYHSTVFPIGTTDVTWTATDSHQNTATVVQRVTITHGPIVKLNISANPSSLNAGANSTITVAGQDQYGNITTSDNSTIVILFPDNGGSLGNTILTLASGVKTTTLTKESAGLVHVNVSSGSLTPAQVSVTFNSTIVLDTTPPTVAGHSPLNSATDVSVNTVPFVTFSESLKLSTVNSGNIQLRKFSGDTVVPATVSLSLIEGETRVNITPVSVLDYGTQYYFAVSSGVQDEAGNPLSPVLDNSTKESHQFTTAANMADLRAPTITAHSPIAETGVSVSVAPSVTFNKSLKSSTVNSASVGFALTDGTPVAATVSLADAGTRVVITPATTLAYNTGYKITVSTGITDEAGNAFAGPVTYTFTTEAELIPSGIDYIVNPDDSNFRAQPTDSYLGGWHYTFRITVNNMDETNLSVKFEDWKNTANNATTVPALGNIRLLINSETGGELSGVGITDNVIQNGLDPVKSYGIGKEYSDQTSGPIDISNIDSDPVKPGRQVQFDVFTKLPTNTVAGFYTTGFGIQSLIPPPPAGGSTPTPDTTAPAIDSFVIPATLDSLTVSISSFTAHDDVGVTGYLLTEASSTPSIDDSHWSAATSTAYTFSSEGIKTLYAWAKDAANNISSSLNASVTITLPPATLSSIAITTPATKLSYTVGDLLDLTGLVVTGTYSDSSTQVETITSANVSGFDSTVAKTGQILTITLGGKIITYTVDIVAPTNVATQLKIINLPLTLAANATSSVIRVESQNGSGVPTNVSATTDVNLVSTSVTSLFSSANFDAGTCNDDWTNTKSITIAINTAHKSFCYKDSTVGTPTITVSSTDLTPDSQVITVTQ